MRNLVLAGAMTLGGGIEPTALAGAFAAKALMPDVLVPKDESLDQAVSSGGALETGMEPGGAYAA